MLQFFLNPMMLLALAGVSLPVIAHLLSRRKFDVVNWGAMQFLNPARKTRRKLKLEELLLLLLRMLAIALLAFAASRPWINSGFLTGYRSAGSRDIVIVIDGSNSMSRSDGLTSLHQKAIRRAEEFLSTLSPGDTVAVIDARDQPVRVVDSPLQDLAAVREQLQTIPPAAGAGNLQVACEEAVGILGRCSNGAREIIVLTDRQRCSWSPGNATSWKRFDDVLSFPSVRPDLWVVDISSGLGPIRQNVSLGRIRLSRDLSVPGFPVSLQVPVRNAGTTPVDVPLQILINGQRVAGMDSTVPVGAQAEAAFTQSIRFSTEGTNLVTVRVGLTDDSVEADNQSHAAVQVTSAIPVLLVEDSPGRDLTRQNTFFASLALTNPENKSPWIVTRTVSARDLKPDDLTTAAAVVLPDVTDLPAELPKALYEFAARGNGVFICLGSATSPESFQKNYSDSGLLSAVRLKRIRSADPDAETAMSIAPYSLEAGWLNRFRERKGASLLQAAFRKWWLVEMTGSGTGGEAPETETVPPSESSPQDNAVSSGRPPTTVAQLVSGDPLLLQAACGRGSVLLMTSNIDTSMNNLAATPDYVPFLHEALFQMAASRVHRNVSFGDPLVTVLTAPGGTPDTTASPDSDAAAASEREMVFQTPDKRSDNVVARLVAGEWTATLPRTRFPGVYELLDPSTPDNQAADAFVVNYDHAEDDPAELTDDDRSRLIVGDRMTFIDSMERLTREMYRNESRSELWGLLLWLFLAMLMFEVWMTRRLVMQGHADTGSRDLTPSTP